MIYFLDTNIFLRVLIKEDPESFKSCFTLLEKIKNGRVEATTSSLVLAEIGWTLASYYQFSKTDVVRSIKSIISLRGLSIDDQTDWLHALTVFEKKKIKLIDCLIASRKEIREKKWTLVSYDKDFEKTEVLCVVPNKI